MRTEDVVLCAEHARLIVDQFSKQVASFSDMRGRTHEEALELLLRATHATGDDSVLDVACGPGLVVFAFAAIASLATGIDLTPAMIQRARELGAQRNISNANFLLGDVTRIP